MTQPLFTRTAWLLLCGLALAGPAAAQITFYEHDNFEGRSFTTRRAVENLARAGFNDLASSAVVGPQRWEVCPDAGYRGNCTVLRPGSYPSLRALGLNDKVSSARTVLQSAQVDDNRYSPAPPYDSRRRNNERLYQANVTFARAVMGEPGQRCWIERQEVSGDNGRNDNVPATIAGAVIGGILGHQIGGGTGRDIATAGGVLGGAVVGNRLGKRNDGPRVQEVQRCATTPASKRPDHWDVGYEFRGTAHRVQMTTQPGQTITVNRQGEPRT
jgi:uncharacterized protein YcfJ